MNIYTGKSKWYVCFLEFVCAIWIFQLQNTHHAISIAHQDFNLEKVHTKMLYLGL